MSVQYGGKDEECPVSTRGGTRRVRSVRGEGGGRVTKQGLEEVVIALVQGSAGALPASAPRVTARPGRGGAFWWGGVLSLYAKTRPPEMVIRMLISCCGARTYESNASASACDGRDLLAHLSSDPCRGYFDRAK